MRSVNTKTSVPTYLTGKRVDGPVSARIHIDGRPHINFFGWGYLALSAIPEIRAAISVALRQEAPLVQQVPAVAGAIDPFFDDVERQAALACNTEAAVYFSSGYFIGTVGLSSLRASFDVVVLDQYAHYSLQDAATLSGVPVFTFHHCDTDSLVDVLKTCASAGQRPVVATDGAFAVSGRVPPLHEYAPVLMRYGGRLFIDEAHSFGVVGEHGRGAAEFCGVEHVATTGATLSKAYCAPGAILGCRAQTAVHLRTIPQVRGACAGSPLSAAAAAASLRYVGRHPELRANLRAKADYLRTNLRRLGLDVIDSPAAIVSFKYGSSTDMQALQRRLFDRGIYVVYATSYMGCGPEGMLRCAVFRDHTHADIDALVAAVAHS